ncbi:glycosyltransferase [Winogradskyella psychrotolerans]|uniref:glycosyltransferase n=1 Tax=Winogradskyella psychrotolerans TaxID=1344585 RepID=UPI001C07C097|nr:glycosyltransferase [Winogradskyella psychrotolerans]MBU2926788.1 glycosyltransferase [Winogradskyella psychrotolerans]
MSKKKIVHILHSVGGVDTSLRVLIKAIDSSKFENIVIHGTKDNSNFLDDTNNYVKEYKIPIERDINVLKDFKSIIKAYKIIKKEKPDLIHAHSAKGGLVGNSIGFILNSINVLHTPQAYSFLSASNGLKRRFYVLIERVLKNKKSILLASSNSELERGISEIKYKKTKTALFNNCISPITLDSEFSDISQYNLPEEYICTVGRPSYQKNIELMVEVLKEVKKEIPNVHLVIMGIGVVSPNTENVKQLIKSYGLEANTTLIEWTERERIFHIVSKSKLYITTARYEGLPYAVIESLALSKSIIATDCDGNRDLVFDGKNGYLVDAEDISLMSKRTIELIKNDSQRLEFEKNSLEIFNQNFNLEGSIKNLEALYLKYCITR